MTTSRWHRLLRTFVTDWRQAFPLFVALVRGTYYAVFFRVFRRAVTIEVPFLAFQAVSITGPGTVRIRAYCSVHSNVSRGLSIATLCPSAEVTIGAHCSVGGLTIRCLQAVTIGPDSRTAFCLIQDAPFWSGTAGDCGSHNASAPVRIGRNVWLGAFSIVLGGSTLGDDSVVGWGGCCAGAEIPAGTTALGNPVTRPLSIARVLALRETR